MKLGLLGLNRSIICLKCGILTRPSSSTTRTFCTLRNAVQRVNHRPLLTVVSKVLRSDRLAVTTKRQKPPSLKDVKFEGKYIKFMLSLAWEYKARISSGIFLLGVTSGIFLSVPRILGKLLDLMANPDKPVEVDYKKDFLGAAAYHIKQNPVILFATLLTGSVCMLARIYLVATAAQLIINRLRTKVFRSIIRQDISFFDRGTNSVGELVSRLGTDVAIVGQSVSNNLMNGTRAFVGFVGAGAMMVFTSPELTMTGIYVLPLFAGMMGIAGILSSRFSRQMQDAIAGSNRHATERFANIKTVRTLVTEDKEVESYKRKINEIWLVAKKTAIATGGIAGVMNGSAYGILATMLYSGGNLVSQGLMTFGDLSSFLLYSVVCVYNVGVLQEFYTELMKGLGASKRLIDLATEQPKIPLHGGIKIGEVKREICFQSVAFAYPDNPVLFHDITFSIPAGKVTAIVGASGSGKSTIANLILRLYDPKQGRIVIDDIDLKDLDPSHWRRQIGTVSQEPVLFTGSIKENIAYGAENPESITDKQIIEVANQANCFDFIQNKPEGFDTLVGEAGSTGLSGGEKQRVAIARAMLKNPKLLIMDEATSALDAESEFFIRQALRKLIMRHQQTVIIIAHRLVTIKHADQIIVLDKGRVGEKGTYEELMSIDNGIFKKLVEKQAFGAKEDSF